MNSRTKGAIGEREVASMLREYGYKARRGQQYSGAKQNISPWDILQQESSKNRMIRSRSRLTTV